MKRIRDKEIAGLYQRGKNLNYTWKYRVNGRQKYLATQTNDLAKAIEIVRAFKASPFKEADNDFIQAIEKFINYKKETVNYSDNSERWARSSLKSFGNFSKNVDPSLVNPVLIKKFKAHLAGKVGTTSADICLRAVKSFFTWCVKVEKICINSPFEGIKIGSGSKSARISYCSRKTRDFIYDNSPNDDLTFILFCGFDTGFRKEEIICARRDWFFLDEKIPYVKVKQALAPPRLRKGEKPFRIKNKKERIVPLTKKFTNFLKKYLKKHNPLDFALQPKVGYGEAVYRYDFRRPFEEYIKSTCLKDSEGEKITTHTMRHTFASLLLSHEKVSLFDVAKYLGDTVNVAETNYAHFIPAKNKTEYLHKK
ncbi:MAG: site-specific integrase [Verrucomicrobiae bacterium]|nr:site-specific integrase [Verrucomicrobiae bacterium]